MITSVATSTLAGIDGIIIHTEVDCSKGFPGWTIVGLPNTSIRESKNRIKAAMKNSTLNFPSQYHITINLAPADIPKEGTGCDVPIAVGLLINTYRLSYDTTRSMFMGECGLDGSIRPISGVLSAAIAAQKAGFNEIFVPAQNAAEAALVPNITVRPCVTLTDIFNHLNGTSPIAPASAHAQHTPQLHAVDFSDIKGQSFAKRALTIAAAGGHNVLMVGPPGSGKTLLAQAMPTIMPPLNEQESIDVTRIHSAAGFSQTALIQERPFRSPHHTASAVSLTGGGRIPKPGEISLAHHGILFLDEFPEFPRSVLEILRQPLEHGSITISRAHGTYTYPAQCMLVAAHNPCPCGFADDPEKPCICSPAQRIAYTNKISGPLRDRIDIHMPVRRIGFEQLNALEPETSSASLRERVIQAQTCARARIPNTLNARMNLNDMKNHCKLSHDSETLLKNAYEQHHMSGRALHRTLKVARTIADLEQSQQIQTAHLAEALQVRI